MAVDQWKAVASDNDLLWEVMKEHMELRPAMTDIMPEHLCILMRDETPKSWGMMAGKLVKASKTLPILTDKTYTYKFVLDIGADRWNTYTDLQKRALLFHLLCRIDAQEDEEAGTVKLGTRQPPIQAFPEEMQKYGMWWPVNPDFDDMAAVLTEAAETR